MLKIFAILAAALWLWIVPAAHLLPVDSDGPSGMTDGNDFDDLILSITSPTAAVATPIVLVVSTLFVAVSTIMLLPAEIIREHPLRLRSPRAPPLA
jgi:hypothetical protein